MRRRLIYLLVVIVCTVFTLGSSSPRQPKVIIVQDEMPQMEVLAKFLREHGKLSVTITDQSSFPENLSAYDAVIVFIHRDLQENTENSIINYTKKGGKLICLHHSISSKKAQNKFTIWSATRAAERDSHWIVTLETPMMGMPTATEQFGSLS